MTALRLCWLALLLASGGCMTLQSYEGEKRSGSEVARISGDLRFTNAPVTVILRQVDGRTLGVSESAVEVLPGPHTLLVDCRVGERSSVSRHTIEAEVVAGRRYKLVAETGSGMQGCRDVLLEAVD